jgi:hypothetical protein
MAVINIEEREFVSGTFTGEEYTYEVIYQCETDTNAGPDIVRRDSAFRIGKEYSFGGESNPEAKLSDVRVNLLSRDRRTTWLVSCTFSTNQSGPSPGGGGGGGGGGSPPSKDKPKDPEVSEKFQTLEVRFFTDTEPAYGAKFVDAGTLGTPKEGEEPTNCAYVKFFNTLGPDKSAVSEYAGVPLNSALSPIDPIPSKMSPKLVVRCHLFDVVDYLEKVFCSRFEASPLGKINESVYSIKGPGEQYTLTFPARTLKLISATVDAHDYRDEMLWYSMEFLYDPCGHYLIVPDMGMKTVNDFEPETQGTDDGRYPFEKNIEGGAENVKDESGDPIMEPCRLDGRGSPLTGASRGTTFAIRYLEDLNVEYDFSKLPTF